MKSFKTSRTILPSLMEVLNRSRYDGEKLTFTISVVEKEATISFDADIAGNYFHGRVEEAKALYEERKARSSIPFVTERNAQSPAAMQKIRGRYGKRSYITR